MNHGAHVRLPLLLDRGEGRGGQSNLFAWFIGRLFLINISFGAAQDSSLSSNRESQEYQRQRTLITGNLLPLMPAQHLRFV